MPPKRVNLAYAGRKLLGPPEGYDKKKELQVKRWLQSNPPPGPQDTDVTASIASVSEVGGDLDPELEELFEDLHDSGDLDMAINKAQRKVDKAAAGAPVPRPPKQPPRPVLPAGPPPPQAVRTRPQRPSSVQPPRVSAQYAALGLAPPTAPTPRPTSARASNLTPPFSATGAAGRDSEGLPHTSTTPAGAAAATAASGRAPLPPPGSQSLDATQPQSTLPPLRTSRDQEHKPVDAAPGGDGAAALPSAAPQSPAAKSVGPSSSEYPDSSSGTPSLSPSPGPKPGPIKGISSPRAESPKEQALPLDFVLDGFGLDNALGVLGGAVEGEDARQATAVAAGMFIARAEAASAVHATQGPISEADKFKAALLMAVREKQRLAEEVRGELAAARAANASAQQGALQKLAGAAADAAAAAQRAAAAEAETGRLHAELARLQQDGKVRRMDLEDREEDHRLEVSRLQAEITAAVSRLEAQGESREKSLKAAHEESMAAREAAAALDRQYKLLRRQYELDKTRLETEVASLRNELRAHDTDMAKLARDKQKAIEGWQAEAAARIMAQESEKRALKAASKQAEIADSLTQAQHTNTALKQQQSLAAQRTAALRAADPAAAALNATAATPAKVKRPGAATGANSPGEHAQVEGRPISPRKRPTTPKGSPRARINQDGDETELNRAEQHRGLSRALAADKAQLGEVLRNQKRALLAAQLAENRAVEEALAVAPEQLRVLGLAFRALLVAAPSELTPEANGAQLAMGLGSAGYRTFVDPQMVTPQPPPIPTMPGLDIPPSAPMVGISGAVVLLATPGLLSTPSGNHPSPHQATHPQPASSSPNSNASPGTGAEGGAQAQQHADVNGGAATAAAAQPSSSSSSAAAAAAAGAASSVESPSLPAVAVMEAAVRGVPLVIVAHQDLTLESLMGTSGTVAPPARISGTGEPTIGPHFTEKAMTWIHAAWASRIIIPQTTSSSRQPSLSQDQPSQPPPQGGSQNQTTQTQDQAAKSLAGQSSESLPPWALVAQRLGIPDSELKGISLDTLKRMSVLKTLCVPDLRHLNCERVSHLKVLITPDHHDQQQQRQQAVGMRLHTLLDVLRGNTTLTALTLRGCSIEAAEAVARVVAGTDLQLEQQQQGTDSYIYTTKSHTGGTADSSSPRKAAHTGASSSSSSSVCSVTVGMEVPVGGLLSKPGVPPLLEVDLSQAGALFTPMDAAVLQTTLQAATASPQGCALRSLSLPLELSPAFQEPQAQEVLARLSSAIAQLPHLEKLNGARVTSADSLAASAASSGVVDLSGNALGPIATSVLLGGSQPSRIWGPALQALNLTGCQISPSGAALLARAIQKSGSNLPGLQMACLADNQMGPSGAAAVCAALMQQQQGGGASKLRVLDLTLNLLGDEGAKGVARALKEASPPLSSLSTLVLSGNAISVDGARALAQALPSLPALCDLQLPGNYLGDMGVSALSKAAAGLDHLRTLHLQENYNIGTEGARALGSLLSSSSTLKELQLAKNHIGVEGARQLALGLAANSSIVSLTLEWCKMRGEGVTHFAAALTGHKSLLALNLARNGIGDRGVKSVAEAMESNTVLRRLDLRANSIGLIGCRLVASMLRERNTTLLQVFMAGNEMEEHVLQAIEDLAATPRSLPQRKKLTVPPVPGGPTPLTAPATFGPPFQHAPPAHAHGQPARATEPSHALHTLGPSHHTHKREPRGSDPRPASAHAQLPSRPASGKSDAAQGDGALSRSGSSRSESGGGRGEKGVGVGSTHTAHTRGSAHTSHAHGPADRQGPLSRSSGERGHAHTSALAAAADVPVELLEYYLGDARPRPASLGGGTLGGTTGGNMLKQRQGVGDAQGSLDGSSGSVLQGSVAAGGMLGMSGAQGGGVLQGSAAAGAVQGMGGIQRRGEGQPVGPTASVLEESEDLEAMLARYRTRT